MQSKESIQQGLEELKRKYGDWTFDIPLPFDIWTNGNLQIPQTRLKRIVQVVKDLSEKPLSDCRILDLGCLDGIFSIEFAQQGAATIGVEIREANIQKAIFCKDVLELHNLDFRQDDVRNISLESYGRFDAIICSGILYHLPAADAIKLIKTMFEMVDRVVVIDTHVSLASDTRFSFQGDEYWGSTYQEYPEDYPPDAIAKNLWASANNPTSFWFTRPSLVNLLNKAGFSSIYECFVPVHFIPADMNFERSGIAFQDRCTFVALKGAPCNVTTSPITNDIQQAWPEHSLSYAPPAKTLDDHVPLHKRLLSRLRGARA
jgi:SAM-dependent methyltransferase